MSHESSGRCLLSENFRNNFRQIVIEPKIAAAYLQSVSSFFIQYTPNLRKNLQLPMLTQFMNSTDRSVRPRNKSEKSAYTRIGSVAGKPSKTKIITR